MRRRLVFSPLFVLCGRFSSGPDQDSPGGRDAAIRDVVQKYEDSRNTTDAKAVAALFTADSDQLVSSGEWRKGRDAVVQGTMASSGATGGKRTLTVESIRYLATDVAHRRCPLRPGGTCRRPGTPYVEHLPADTDNGGLAHRGHPQHAARGPCAHRGTLARRAFTPRHAYGA